MKHACIHILIYVYIELESQKKYTCICAHTKRLKILYFRKKGQSNPTFSTDQVQVYLFLLDLKYLYSLFFFFLFGFGLIIGSKSNFASFKWEEINLSRHSLAFAAWMVAENPRTYKISSLDNVSSEVSRRPWFCIFFSFIDLHLEV